MLTGGVVLRLSPAHPSFQSSLRQVALLPFVLASFVFETEGVALTRIPPRQPPGENGFSDPRRERLAAPEVRHVVLISVDGLGAQLLERMRASSPAIQRMLRDGDAAARARTIDPPLTVPSHISMLAGVDPKRHKLLHNDMDEKLSRLGVPSLFDLAKRKGISTAAVVGKAKLRYVFDTGSVDRFHQPSSWLLGEYQGRFPSVIEARAVDVMEEMRPSFLWIHYALPDTIGHWFKWGGWQQRIAVRLVDASIARLNKKIQEVYPPHSVAVILTADHGGHEGAHGQTRPDGGYEAEEADVSIPWIVLGAELKPGIESVQIYDTAPSVAHLLGLEVPKEWHWQGRSVLK